MQYILKNFSLNQVYYIDKNALYDVAKNIFNEDQDNIKISKYEIKMLPNKKVFNMEVSLLTIKDGDTIQIIKRFTKMIENKFLSIFNIKPNNILIEIEGTF